MTLPLLDGRRLQTNQCSESGAIQVSNTPDIDNDASSKRNEWPDQILDLVGGPHDQFAMTLDGRHGIPAFIGGLLEVTAERTISGHRTEVSFCNRLAPACLARLSALPASAQRSSYRDGCGSQASLRRE